MGDKIKKLIDVKSIVTLLLIGVFAYLVVRGMEIPDMFYQSLALVLAYYFTRKVGGDGE